MFKRDFCEDTSQNKSLVEEIRNFLSVSIDTKSIPTCCNKTILAYYTLFVIKLGLLTLDHKWN